jgi:protein TonB
MTQRLIGSAIGAILVTLALVTIMQSLVAMGDGGLTKNKGVRIEDFLRTMDDSDTQSKKRELPDKEEVEEAPEMEQMELEAAPSELKMDGMGISAQPDLALAGGVGVGSADMDTVPLVRVAPRYPPRAQSRGIEGWVQLEFTITPQGTVTDVKIIDAEPRGYFERSAKRAVQKYKYKPKVMDGKAVSRPGIQLVISFDMEDD